MMTSKDKLYEAFRVLPKKVRLLYKHYSFLKYNSRKCNEDLLFFGDWKDLYKVPSLFYRDKHILEWLEDYLKEPYISELADVIYVEKLSYTRSKRYGVFHWIISIHEKGDYGVREEKNDITLFSGKDSIFNFKKDLIFDLIKRGNFTVLE